MNLGQILAALAALGTAIGGGASFNQKDWEEEVRCR